MSTAFIFPGQGSQSVGMLSEFYKNFDYVARLFSDANDILGYNLWHIITNDEAKLRQTIYTQTAMFVSGLACYEVLKKESNLEATIMAGHSLGEITAIVAGGSTDFSKGVAIVNKRAELMQGSLPNGSGAMAAILGLDDDIVTRFCKQYNGEGVVEVANFNAVGQVVIAGHLNAVKIMCITLKKEGAKRTVLLPMNIASHSSLMQDAADKFIDFLNDYELQMPIVKVLHNVNAELASTTEEIKKNLAEQLVKPVLWTSVIKNMLNYNIKKIIEVGPGKVLAGIGRRIDKSISYLPLYDLQTLRKINA